MNITVFGANGKVGRLVTKLLLERGHTVTAFTRSGKGLPKDKQLTSCTGDIHDEIAVEKAIKGAEVVISTLGSWHTPTKDIVSSGMKNIIPAMHSNNSKRLISLTGAEARSKRDVVGPIHWIAHLFASLGAGKILKDAEDHLMLLEKSNLDWTALRSPIMNELSSKNYSLSNKRPLPWTTIHRAGVARAVVDQVDDSSMLQQSPYLRR
jgi:putative NADH-flavin reductase